ncbi:MAG: tRNA (adenosine(37)-N6)-threonylcarbamoyltransferase complex transferase subunit TsaD [Flavobacteriaceae bacterium]|nr:tRNA (adenosine(37)-N6)-threonylcarbamoyltransferase complex transferase subunit TsaD [Flavobacteriaceae bacterium]|tara:strand:+ start:105 stop:1112 length:1008 start_codon:yes stop_codon:yes gene_type:complete
MINDVYILAIETSCDDTSVAILKNEKVLSNIVSSQKIHEIYGGVVPELASREHDRLIIPVIKKAIYDAGVNLLDMHAIAYTRGPGLLGSLLVGTSFAKSIALSLDVPLIEINHMQAHILSIFIDDNPKKPKFPFIALTVSGGHTQLVLVKGYEDFVELGTTLDDAAGEAFDKSGKLMNLNYPAGPKIDKLASKGDFNRFKFPKPKVDDYNFSFSGLKTSFKNFITKQSSEFVQDNIHDICASLQFTIINILIDKIIKVKNKYEINDFVVCGGVSANSFLRKKLKQLEQNTNIKTYVPKINYSTDNAAMIGINGYFKFRNSRFGKLSDYSESKYKV